LLGWLRSEVPSSDGLLGRIPSLRVLAGAPRRSAALGVRHHVGPGWLRFATLAMQQDPCSRSISPLFGGARSWWTVCAEQQAHGSIGHPQGGNALQVQRLCTWSKTLRSSGCARRAADVGSKEPGRGGEQRRGCNGERGSPTVNGPAVSLGAPERSGCPGEADGSVRRASTTSEGAASAVPHQADGCVQGERLRRVVRPWERISCGSTAGGMADPHVPLPVGRRSLETGRTPGSAAGCNKPAR